MRIRDIYLMLSVGLFFRVCVSLWNGFWGPSIGAEADAASFHQAASNLFNYPGTINELSEIASGSQNNLSHHPDYAHGFHLLKHFYAQLLARVYFLTTDSLFIGGLFSALTGLTASIPILFLPKLIDKKISDPEAERDYLVRVIPTLVSMWLIFIIPGLIFIPWFFLIVFGLEFESAIPILLVLCIAVPGSIFSAIYAILFELQGRLGRA